MELPKSNIKKEKKDKVLETGKKIETWLVNWKPELTEYLEFTDKANNLVKQKTGIELPLIVAKGFIGVGNIIGKHHDKVNYFVII